MSCDGLGVIVRCTPAGGPAGCIVFPFSFFWTAVLPTEFMLDCVTRAGLWAFIPDRFVFRPALQAVVLLKSRGGIRGSFLFFSSR